MSFRLVEVSTFSGEFPQSDSSELLIKTDICLVLAMQILHNYMGILPVAPCRGSEPEPH